MTGLEFTGERFIPGESPASIEAEHRARYQFACKYVRGRNVLDLGCGEGYGSRMLDEVADSVIGVDIDEAVIRHAKAAHSGPGVHFHVADVAKLPFRDGEFSACVCFEVVEHIENPAAMLREAVRALDPQGVFLISTPNGAVRMSSRPNPFHVKEYNLREFAALLREAFPESHWNMEIHGQFVRGKWYSALGVALKNLYLTLKGMLDFSPPSAQPESDTSSRSIEFDFRTNRAQLAEYLVAIITGRG